MIRFLFLPGKDIYYYQIYEVIITVRIEPTSDDVKQRTNFVSILKLQIKYWKRWFSGRMLQKSYGLNPDCQTLTHTENFKSKLTPEIFFPILIWFLDYDVTFRGFYWIVRLGEDDLEDFYPKFFLSKLRYVHKRWSREISLSNCNFVISGHFVNADVTCNINQ